MDLIGSFRPSIQGSNPCVVTKFTTSAFGRHYATNRLSELCRIYDLLLNIDLYSNQQPMTIVHLPVAFALHIRQSPRAWGVNREA